MARVVHVITLTTALVATSVLLGGCGTNSAVTQARAACVDVRHALRLQRASEVEGLPAPRRHYLQNRALGALLAATPAAARATSLDGSWNPLMTTINEAERVPLGHLVDALTRLCRVADSRTPYL